MERMGLMDIVIREVNREDTELLRRIEAGDGYPYPYKKTKEDYEKYMDEGDEFFIAEADDAPAGYISMVDCIYLGRTVCRLHLLAVLKEYQGKGIGTRLIQHFEEQAKSEGHKFKTDLIDEVMDIAQPAHVSDYGIMSQVAEGVSRHIFLVYPERVGTQQSAIPTLNVVKEEFSEILDPSSKLPIELLYGVGDPSSSYFIRTYSVSIDVKRPSLVLGGSVSAKGETDSSNKDVMTGPEGQQIGRQDDPVKTAEEVRSGENGPKVPVRSGVGSATSPALMKELVNAAVEKANKVLLNVELVQPVPYFFQGFKVRVKGIKEFDGTYTIGEVSQKMTGTTMWTTSLDLLSKTGGPKVDKSAGKGKGQTPVESDDLEGPEGEVVGRQPAPVRKVTAK